MRRHLLASRFGRGVVDIQYFPGGLLRRLAQRLLVRLAQLVDMFKHLPRLLRRSLPSLPPKGGQMRSLLPPFLGRHLR